MSLFLGPLTRACAEAQSAVIPCVGCAHRRPLPGDPFSLRPATGSRELLPQGPVPPRPGTRGTPLSAWKERCTHRVMSLVSPVRRKPRSRDGEAARLAGGGVPHFPLRHVGLSLGQKESAVMLHGHQGPLRVFLKNVTRTAGREPELGLGCGQISCWDPQAFRQGGLLRTEWCWQSNPAACWWALGVGAGV